MSEKGPKGAGYGYRSNGRTKENAEQIYLATVENIEARDAWSALQKQKANIEKEQDKILKLMKSAKSLAQEVSE